MSVVNCNRAEVVACSCLKQCWSSAGWTYLLIVGRIRNSRTLADGQRSEIGRYEDSWEVYLPGVCIGMINEYSRDLTIGDREVEEGSDVLNRSRSKIFQVEDAEFVGAKCLTISTALDCSRNYVRGKSLRHLH